jgi:hypothetical protein
VTQDEADQVSWRTFEDTVRRWLPEMTVSMLGAVVADLRPGGGGPWDGLPAGLDCRRQLLLDEVIGVATKRLGGPWPIVGDALPAAPDSPAELV